MKTLIVKPLLSICIPTYNRADYLEKCLTAIVSQEAFEEIEVVISDNCSTDDTEKIGKKYEQKYKNIVYFRNEKNIHDMNFPLVLQRARGTLRKLTNDTVIYKPGAIRYMLDAVRECVDKQHQVYFLNSEGKDESSHYYQKLEDYIGNIGYLLTWIGAVAIWEDDCDDLSTFINNTDSKIAQVPYLLEHFEKHNGAVIYPKHIMDGIIPKNKNVSYGLYKVFYENFLGYIKPYVERRVISKECYDRVRKILLIEFFCPWIVKSEKYREEYLFAENENLKELIEKEYKDETYYKEYKWQLLKLRIKTSISKYVGK